MNQATMLLQPFEMLRPACAARAADFPAHHPANPFGAGKFAGGSINLGEFALVHADRQRRCHAHVLSIASSYVKAHGVFGHDGSKEIVVLNSLRLLLRGKNG